ncbi:hypothetical protein [Pseudonocardia zijingensis]|uniref:Uncharacterized protein n=1 Tax=Pseudonocardia zijingensis TaxID=153376 RepID=A0ABN1NJJ0_9PSEU
MSSLCSGQRRIGHWKSPRDEGAVIGTLGWVIVVAAAWLAVAAGVGVLVGRLIRERDRQVPPSPEPPPATRRGPADPVHRGPDPGRGRRP